MRSVFPGDRNGDMPLSEQRFDCREWLAHQNRCGHIGRLPDAAYRCDRLGRLDGFDEPTSFLGIEGQACVDPLRSLHAICRPGAKPPSLINCQVRLNSGMIGAKRCKSFLCPRCHQSRQRHLRKKVLAILRRAQTLGMGMSFMTLTLSHSGQSSLAHGIDAISEAWVAARRGGPYRRMKAALGLIGVLNFFEVTLGVFGWHPHLHSIVICENQTDADVCAERLARRYEHSLLKKGWRVNARTSHAQRVTAVDGLAEYVVKDWRATKNSPLQLARLAMSGCPAAADFYFEAVEAMNRKRHAVLSPSLHHALFD